MKNFAGWIPNIAGQLSFSLIGLRGGAAGCVTANSEVAPPTTTPPHRIVLITQRRATRDVPLPLRLLLPARIKQYLLIGETSETKRPTITGNKVEGIRDEIGRLTGQVYIIPHHRQEQLKKIANKLVCRTRNILNTRPKTILSITGLRKEILDELTIGRKSGLKILKANFELYRTGELRISIEDEQPDALARQVYYFIKDTSHRHYHHRPSSDNLLPLTRAEREDDETWRRNTLWALTRSVLEARRRDKLEGYKSQGNRVSSVVRCES